MKNIHLQLVLFMLTLSCSSYQSREAEVVKSADLIIKGGKIATLSEDKPFATALAAADGKIIAIGTDQEMERYKATGTREVDLGGRTVIPGLNDSHLHAVRGGRFYNTELRWDGVPSLKIALQMLREQADRTPKGQWVRVIGGWSPFQFEEKRFPTPQELNEAAPDTPVFILFLYSRGWLNTAGLQALNIDENTAAPVGGRYEKDDKGKLTGVLLAEPDPTILYKTISALPPLSESDMLNSTRQFYRELNRLGLTSVIDAGGGGHKFPKDYAGTLQLAEAGDMPIRVSYYLFPQEKGKEYQEFQEWMKTNKAGEDMAHSLPHGYELEGGGEFLVWSAGDYENFLAPQPMLEERKEWKAELKAVTRLLVEKQWPFRIHATYGESVSNILDAFEEVDRETNNGFSRIRWAFDHGETVTERELKRIKALGGGIAVQARMAYAGEYFVQRYGAAAASHAPPVKKILEMGLPIGAGTDGTRVASYNPWPSLYWLVSGKTVGGLQLYPQDNRLTRQEALRLYTQGSAWFSQEEDVKGILEVGKMADFAVLSGDYFNIPEDEIRQLESVLTVVGGKVVYAAGEFRAMNPSLPEVSPSWSPVKHYGGYYTNGRADEK